MYKHHLLKINTVFKCRIVNYIRKEYKLVELLHFKNYVFYLHISYYNYFDNNNCSCNNKNMQLQSYFNNTLHTVFSLTLQDLKR